MGPTTWLRTLLTPISRLTILESAQSESSSTAQTSAQGVYISIPGQLPTEHSDESGTPRSNATKRKYEPDTDDDDKNERVTGARNRAARAYSAYTDGDSDIVEVDAAGNEIHPEDAVDTSEDDHFEEATEWATSDSSEESSAVPPIHNIRLQKRIGRVKAELSRVADTLRTLKLNHDQSSNLDVLYQSTCELSMFEYPKTRIVGFIGESGVGKSSVINSLLDQPSLSRSSSDGTACTSVVTEFRHVNNTHRGPFNIEAKYMSEEEMKELLEELLLTYRQFYCADDPEKIARDEGPKCQDDADRAWVTLQSLFRDRLYSRNFLERDNYSDILGLLVQWARNNLPSGPGASNAFRYSTTASSLEECKNCLDQLTTNNVDGHQPAHWHFIRLIRVYLSSPILKGGLVLADLPGFRDLNYARVRATERYLVQSCDQVFAVANIDRAASNESIRDILRRCSQNQPPRVILTKSEIISAQESARGESADARELKQINMEIKAIQSRIQEIESRSPDAEQAEQRDLALMIKLAKEEKALRFKIKTLIIKKRNSRVSEQLIDIHKEKYPGLAVFCISNIIYSDDYWEGHRELANIRELRDYCKFVPAADQMRSTSTFLDHQVPALLLSLRQWALSGTDLVTAERADILGVVLEHAREALEQLADMCKSQPSELSSETWALRSSIAEHCVRAPVLRHQNSWRNGQVEASKNWDSWHHATYAAFCRQHGDRIHPNPRIGPQCWNEELVKPAHQELESAWKKIEERLETQTSILIGKSLATFEELNFSIQAQVSLAPHALRNLQKSMKHREMCISEHIEDSWHEATRKFGEITHVMLSGTASSLISEAMIPAYNEINQLSGRNSYKAKKDLTKENLTTPPLLERYFAQAHNKYNGTLDDCYNRLQRRITEQARCLIQDIRAAVPVENRSREVTRAPQLTDALTSQLDRTESILQDAQTVVQELKGL